MFLGMFQNNEWNVASYVNFYRKVLSTFLAKLLRYLQTVQILYYLSKTDYVLFLKSTLSVMFGLKSSNCKQTYSDMLKTIITDHNLKSGPFVTINIKPRVCFRTLQTVVMDSLWFLGMKLDPRCQRVFKLKKMLDFGRTNGHKDVGLHTAMSLTTTSFICLFTSRREMSKAVHCNIVVYLFTSTTRPPPRVTAPGRQKTHTLLSENCFRAPFSFPEFLFAEVKTSLADFQNVKSIDS